MNKRVLVSLILMIVSLTIFTIFAVIIYKSLNEPTTLDVTIRDLFYNTRGNKYGFVFWFFRIITECGDLYFLIVFAILVILYCRFDYRTFIIGGVMILAVLLNYVLKHTFNRERPIEEYRWMVDETSSFPSGHSSIICAAGLITGYFVWRLDIKGCIKYSIIGGISLLVILVIISRLVLGMHYFTDVVAGASLGVLCASAGIMVSYFFEKYNILQKPLFNYKKKEEKTE